jgi:hypothetical protein
MREGMTILEWDLQQQQDFLGWLIDSHTRALRAVNLIGTVPPLSFIRDRFAAFMDNTEFDVRLDMTLPANPDEQDATNALPAPAKIPEFSPALLADAIRELKVDINVIDDMFDSDFNPVNPADGTAPVAEASNQSSSEGREFASTSDVILARVAAERAAAEEAINSTEDVLARLKSGVAIEINLYGQASLAKLNWVSPNEASLVLTIENRPKPSVISVRLFRWLLRIGRARFVEASPLFERAVGSLLETADEIDAANEAQ